MTIYLEIGSSQLKKTGEELCGDSIEIQKKTDFDIVVLSDGLGSGVKANILSQVTAKTASTMLKQGSKIDEVIETLAQTLPICKVRKMAYSTFTIIQIFSDGRVYLAEYDNPNIFWGRHHKLRVVEYRERAIDNKGIRESFFKVKNDDWIVLCSDGILHAGIGDVWDFGWGRERFGEYLQKSASENKSSSEWAHEITAFCRRLYKNQPGDDASVVVIKVRNPRFLTILIGPPADKRNDETVVNRLLHSPGQKIVCGGTTANIVSRCLNTEVRVDLDSNDEKVPPVGIIPGIDLVTEGTLTLAYVIEILRNTTHPAELRLRNDGASRLAIKMMKADTFHLMIGTAENPAQKDPKVPKVFAFKQQIIKNLIEVLEIKNKKIKIDYY